MQIMISMSIEANNSDKIYHVCSACPITVTRLPAYNLYSNTHKVCSIYMYRRKIIPIGYTRLQIAVPILT